MSPPMFPLLLLRHVCLHLTTGEISCNGKLTCFRWIHLSRYDGVGLLFAWIISKFIHNQSWLSVSDVDPPSFGSTCPSSPLIAFAKRKKFSALVNWTHPVAADSSGVSPTVTSNYQSPTRFSQGTHVITYTAVDQSGNKAVCNFTVHVLGTT